MIGESVGSIERLQDTSPGARRPRSAEVLTICDRASLTTHAGDYAAAHRAMCQAKIDAHAACAYFSPESNLLASIFDRSRKCSRSRPRLKAPVVPLRRRCGALSRSTAAEDFWFQASGEGRRVPALDRRSCGIPMVVVQHAAEALAAQHAAAVGGICEVTSHLLHPSLVRLLGDPGDGSKPASSKMRLMVLRPISWPRLNSAPRMRV